MRKIVLLVLGMMLLLASGCNGIQVVDNTYDSIGGKKFHVADDFEYKGVVDVYTKAIVLTALRATTAKTLRFVPICL